MLKASLAMVSGLIDFNYVAHSTSRAADRRPPNHDCFRLAQPVAPHIRTSEAGQRSNNPKRLGLGQARWQPVDHDYRT